MQNWQLMSGTGRHASIHLLVVAVAALFLLGACNKSISPDEGRGGSSSSQLTPDGYYRVKRGDSLHAIAFDYGLDWRDIAKWNGIKSPYVIYPDQALRLEAPKQKAQVTTSAAQPRPTVSERPVEKPAASTRSEPVAKSTPPPVKSSGNSKPVTTADPSRWLWPVEGRLLSSFKAGDPARNGIEIAGKEGQAIRSSAAGEVVYSGSGLIGYGQLIIIKHSERLLSAYAHNRKRLVAEGQAVSAGEKIAEMGRDDRNRAMLHFEIRRDGNPQDPLKFLPKR
jgi:lipoprotein NlpD